VASTGCVVVFTGIVVFRRFVFTGAGASSTATGFAATAFTFFEVAGVVIFFDFDFDDDDDDDDFDLGWVMVSPEKAVNARRGIKPHGGGALARGEGIDHTWGLRVKA
jgi:hypothetical protein